MPRKPKRATYAPQTTDYDWQQREGKLAATALSEVLNEQTGRQRKAYACEWERHERLAEILVSSSPAARNLVETLGGMRVFYEDVTKSFRDQRSDPTLDYQFDIMDRTLSDRLTFRSGPFDVVWTDFQPVGARGTVAHGPSADLLGHMSLDLMETYVPRPVAYGGWMRNAAGVGVWFKPKSASTYVRVAPS